MSATDLPPTDDDAVLHAEATLDLLRMALAEDHAVDDVTTAALVDPERTALAEMIVKATGVVCGLPLIARLFTLLDERMEVELLADDGDTIGAGTMVARVRGPAGALLRGERTILNVVQRLSGVATQTAAYVEAALGGAGLYDTRKTTPGWRDLEKYAVRCGGGRNHRLHLADAAMVKENHLVAAYGERGPEAIARAVRTLLDGIDPGLALYVEVEDDAELEAALTAAGPDIGRLVIMLDDFEIEGIRGAVRRVRELEGPRPQLEVTGGVTLERLEGLAGTGVARLSSGALTHSAPALDISLKIRSAT
ncbi:MAG: carboxylating nicotinate-nucleotide diphosphorylase [Planctomycetota bacterium]|nr:carboxylating nicotinate-nucleotide diphosphorylase [Planctomycetota bacterium]